MDTGSNKKLNQLIENDPTLRTIRLPRTGTDCPIIADEVWEMYHKDYCLTVPDIARILDCNNRWVYQYITHEVEHIFLTKYMRNMIHEFRSPSRGDPFLNNYYYFSEISFYNWLKENTRAVTKTILIDSRQIAPEKLEEHSPPSFRKRKEHAPIFLNPPLPKSFYSLTTIREKMDIATTNSAYLHLFRLGTVKYTIAGSLARYSPSVIFRIPSENEVLIWADEAQHYLNEENNVYLRESQIVN